MVNVAFVLHLKWWRAADGGRVAGANRIMQWYELHHLENVADPRLVAQVTKSKSGLHTETYEEHG